MPLRRGRRNRGSSAWKRNMSEAAHQLPNVRRDVRLGAVALSVFPGRWRHGGHCRGPSGQCTRRILLSMLLKPLGTGLCGVQRPVLNLTLSDRAKQAQPRKICKVGPAGRGWTSVFKGPEMGRRSSCVALHGPRPQFVLCREGEV